MNKVILENDISKILQDQNIDWNMLEGSVLLITGANGFIASYLIRTIQKLNATFFKRKSRIIGIVRNLTKYKENNIFLDDPNITLIEHDVSVSLIDIHFEHVDYILHAASPASSVHFSIDPIATIKANVLGTLNLLEFSNRFKVKKFLYFSSGEVYGEIKIDDICADEEFVGRVNCTDIRSCYAESKRMSENICFSWSYQYGVPTNIIRIGYTYGPGLPLDDDRVIVKFTKNVIESKDIELATEGSASRSFCYITDMTRAIFTV